MRWRVLVLGLALLAGQAQANPVPADSMSLLNGSDLYAMHCAECHGWALLDAYYARNAVEEYASEPDFSDLVDQQMQEAESESGADDDLAPWPEWAELPDPKAKASEPDLRDQILDDLTSAIDEVYGSDEPEAGAPPGEGSSVFAALEDGVNTGGPVGDATPLDQPGSYIFGISEQDVYDSIANGSGMEMPAYADQLVSDESIWDLVNFIRSFWPDWALLY